ncbi:MAG: major facilitator superfamily 1 [Firmicutes bacterium]|jgi:MFS family permease|nr:major facilitator superfamily 1 [Bacillota bacterium]
MTELIKPKSWRKMFDYRWTIVMVMLFGSIINYLDRVNLSIANTTIAKEFGLDPIQMGLLLSAFMWPYSLANLPAGWLVDKYGAKKIFLWGILIWSLATIAGGFVQGFMSMYITRMILGIAEAPFFIIGGQVTQQYFSHDERGMASSLINLGPKIANGFAPPLLTFLMLWMGWRGMFITLGAIGIIVAFLWIKYYKVDVNYLSTSFPQQECRQKVNFWALFNHPTSWWFNIGNIGSSYVFWLYFTWLPTYLTTHRGMSLTQAGWAAAIPFIAGVIAVPIGGWISDYLIRKGMNVISARLVPTVGGCVLAAIAVIPVNYIQDTTWAMVLITISLFAGALRVGVLWALVGDLTPPEAVGTFGGIQNFASFIGATLAPIGTGYILQATNSFDYVFVVSGVLCLIGAISYALISKKITSQDLLPARK